MKKKGLNLLINIDPEFGVIHGGPEDCKSTVVIPEAAGWFLLGLVHTSQNQKSNICFRIDVIDITPVLHYTSSIQVWHVDKHVHDLLGKK